MKSGLFKYLSKEYNKEIEFNRFGIISFIILIVSCLGGITVGLGGLNNIFHLILLISSTMSSLVLILAVSPMKWIILSALAALLIDITLIIFYLFQ